MSFPLLVGVGANLLYSSAEESNSSELDHRKVGNCQLSSQQKVQVKLSDYFLCTVFIYVTR